MLAVGNTLPIFKLTDQHGQVRSSEEFKGKKNLVIYFYPKDETPGCTAEACSFRDQYEDFLEYDCEVIGISYDSVDSHKKFAANHKLPFILLSDPKKVAAKAFGVQKSFFGFVPGRETFVFNIKGLLTAKFKHQLYATLHVKDALNALSKNQSEVAD